MRSYLPLAAGPGDSAAFDHPTTAQTPLLTFPTCQHFQCCRSWGHFLLAAVLLQGVQNSSTFGEEILQKGGRDAKSKTHNGFFKINQHRLANMACREPRTLCRGDIPQPRYLWLMPPLSPAESIKDLQVNFLPPACSRIQAVLSITLVFPEVWSPDQWPQVSHLLL